MRWRRRCARRACSPLEELLRRPRVTTVQVDPTGQTLAVIEIVGSHPAVVLYSRDRARARVGVAFRDTVRSVSNVRWSGDGRWLLILHDRGGDEGYRLLRVDPRLAARGEPGASVDLTPFAGAEVELLATPAGALVAIIASNHRDPRVSDVYRVMLDAGALTRVATNPGDITTWALTPAGIVAGAGAVRQDGTLEVRTPPGPGDTTWRVVYRAPPAERFTPQGAKNAASMDSLSARGPVAVRTTESDGLVPVMSRVRLRRYQGAAPAGGSRVSGGAAAMRVASV